MINSQIYSAIFNISSADVIGFSPLPTRILTEGNSSDEIAISTESDAVEHISPPTSWSLLPSSPPQDSDYMEVPVVGLPGSDFTIIHSSALFSISTSVFVSTSLLIFLCSCGRKWGLQKQQQSEEVGTLSSSRGFVRTATADRCWEGSTNVESTADNSDDVTTKSRR
jgi:hypothetical protein